MVESGRNPPPGWTVAAVSQVGSVRLGRQRSPDKQTGRFNTKYLRAANISPDGLNLTDVLEMDFTPAEQDVFALRRGDIVLAEASGSPSHVGRAARWDEQIPDCCYQNTVIRFRPHAAISDYALLVFRHYAESGVFAALARGVGIQHLGATRFAELKFPLPPQAEQHRIIAEAGRRLDRLREADAAMRSALHRVEEQNRHILAAAAEGHLVDPESVLAQREGRPFESGDLLLDRIRGNVTAQPPLFDVGDQSPVDLGDPVPFKTPPGWSWARVDEVGEVTLGKKREPSVHRGPNMRPYLRVANVYEDRIDPSGVKEMHFTPDEYETYALRPGDILLNEGQSPDMVGRPAMYRGEVPGACFQMTLLRFRAGPAVVPDFALIVFRHYLHAGEFRKVARWSTNIAHLSRQRFAAMMFPVPPLLEQRRISAEARRRLQASAAQEAAIEGSLARLPAMEGELLAAAVSGALVPQHEADEPAGILLERVGLPPESPALTNGSDTDPEEESVAMNPLSSSQEDAKSDLVRVLREAGRPLPLPELFSMAGYDRDSTADIELFYLELRAQLGRSLRQVDGPVENALLEALGDAP